MYTTGSIVLARVGRTETLAKIDKVVGDEFFCTKAITCYNGGNWQYTTEEYPDYEGETRETIIRLVDGEEFNTFLEFYPDL